MKVHFNRKNEKFKPLDEDGLTGLQRAAKRVTKSTMPETDNDSSTRLGEVVAALTGDTTYVYTRQRGAYVGHRRGRGMRVERITSVEPRLPGEVVSHEIMHVLETPDALPKQISETYLARHIWNGLEDARIDRIGSKKFGRDILGIHQEMLTDTETNAEKVELGLSTTGTGTLNADKRDIARNASNAVVMAGFGIAPQPTGNPLMDQCVAQLLPMIEKATTITSTAAQVIETSILVSTAISTVLDKIPDPTYEEPEPSQEEERDGGEEPEDGDDESWESDNAEDDEPTDDGATTPTPVDEGEDQDDSSEGDDATSSEQDGDDDSERDIGGDNKTEGEGDDEYTRADHDALAEKMANAKPSEADNSKLAEAFNARASEMKAILNSVVNDTNTKREIRNAKSAYSRRQREREASETTAQQQRLNEAIVKAATKVGDEHVLKYKTITAAYKPSDAHGVTLAGWRLEPNTSSNLLINAAVSSVGYSLDMKREYTGELAPDHWRIAIGDLKVYERALVDAPRIVIMVDNSGSMGHGPDSNSEIAWAVVKAITDVVPDAEVFMHCCVGLHSHDAVTVGRNTSGTVITPVPVGLKPRSSGGNNADCVALLWLENYIRSTGDLDTTLAVVISDGAPSNSTSSCNGLDHTRSVSRQMQGQGLRYASVLVNYNAHRDLYPAELSVQLIGEDGTCDLTLNPSTFSTGVTTEHANSIRTLLETIAGRG